MLLSDEISLRFTPYLTPHKVLAVSERLMAFIYRLTGNELRRLNKRYRLQLACEPLGKFTEILMQQIKGKYYHRLPHS